MADMVAKERSWTRGRKLIGKKFEKFKSRIEVGERPYLIAGEFGVSIKTAYRIKKEILSATSKQLREALLRATGKWKE